MSPDLNAVAGGERFDYSQPGSSGYAIDQNITYSTQVLTGQKKYQVTNGHR